MRHSAGGEVLVLKIQYMGAGEKAKVGGTATVGRYTITPFSNNLITSWRLPRSNTAASPQHKRQVRNKLNWRGHWRPNCVCCVVFSCSFPNSITTTCCQLVVDLLAHRHQEVCKLATI